MRREAFLIEMIKVAGLPYIWGGDGRVGFDCSGLAQHLLGLINLDPPGDQTAHALYRFFSTNGSPIRHPMDAELGDLAFYGTVSRVIHVGVCLGSGLMLEAGGGGSETTTPEEARRRNAKVRVRQVTARRDLMAILRPDGIPWSVSTGALATAIPMSEPDQESIPILSTGLAPDQNPKA